MTRFGVRCLTRLECGGLTPRFFSPAYHVTAKARQGRASDRWRFQIRVDRKIAVILSPVPNLYDCTRMDPVSSNSAWPLVTLWSCRSAGVVRYRCTEKSETGVGVERYWRRVHHRLRLRNIIFGGRTPVFLYGVTVTLFNKRRHTRFVRPCQFWDNAAECSLERERREDIAVSLSQALLPPARSPICSNFTAGADEKAAAIGVAIRRVNCFVCVLYLAGV